MRSFTLRSFLFGQALPDDRGLNFGWLLFRFYTGLSIALGAGLPKIREGLSPEWFVRMVDRIGFHFPSPVFWATIASWGEFVGGLCIALGLLTRPMALQLAFQFFVISFMWYDDPAPITGMYYQQLYFWCFWIVLFVGGGRFSVDRRLARFELPPLALRFGGAALALLVIGLAVFSRQPRAAHTVVYRVAVPGARPGSVAVRGDEAPLSWESDRTLRLLPGTDVYTDTVTYHTPYSFTEVKFVRDSRFELDGQDNRRVSFAGKDTVLYAATFDLADSGKQ